MLRAAPGLRVSAVEVLAGIMNQCSISVIFEKKGDGQFCGLRRPPRGVVWVGYSCARTGGSWLDRKEASMRDSRVGRGDGSERGLAEGDRATWRTRVPHTEYML